MTRLKNKFYLILSGIVGLCLSFCTFLMPKKVDVASADTLSMVEDSMDYYAYLPKNLDLSSIVLPQLPDGSSMAIHVYSDTIILGGSFAKIRYSTLLDFDGYISFRSAGTSPGTLAYSYYIPVSRGDLPITSLEIYVITDNAGSETVTHYSYTNPIDIVTFDYVMDAFNNGYSLGYQDGIDNGYSLGYQDGIDNGYSSGYQEGYDLGNVDGFDNGYLLGKTDGQREEYIEQNRGLWGTSFEFSWLDEYSILRELSITLPDEYYYVYEDGGLNFHELYPVFERACDQNNLAVPNYTQEITVTVSLSTDSTEFLVLSNRSFFVASGGYFLCDGYQFWGSFEPYYEISEMNYIYAFKPFSSLTVAPSSFTFSFHEWEFILYANDGTIGFTDYNVGYNQGFDDGYDEGYTEGYDEGDRLTDESLQNAYNDGYSVGISKAENFDFAHAVSTVIGAPVTVVKEFLSFEILGVNLISFISGLITLMIVVKCIKFFL